MIGAGVFAALAPPPGRRDGAPAGPRARRGGRLLQRHLLGAARRAVTRVGRHVRVRAGAARPLLGLSGGLGFVVGKTACCAAMALTVGAYLWPGPGHAVAVAVVVALTAVNYGGVQKSALVTRVIVAVVLAVLAGWSWSPLRAAPRRRTARPASGASRSACCRRPGCCSSPSPGTRGSRPSGEEVRDPARTIPRAIPLALGIALVVYAAVAVAVLAVLGPTGWPLAAPLADAVGPAGAPGLAPGGAGGGRRPRSGSLLALILGVSRTTLAMAADGTCRAALAAVHPRHQVPHRAELAVGAVVAVLAATADLRGAIGFSSFGVLAYYAVANASAWTLSLGAVSRVMPVVVLPWCPWPRRSRWPRCAVAWSVAIAEAGPGPGRRRRRTRGGGRPRALVGCGEPEQWSRVGRGVRRDQGGGRVSTLPAVRSPTPKTCSTSR